MFIIGIDVSKHKLHCALLVNPEPLKVKTKILPNSAAECAALLAWAQRHSGGEIEQLHFIADGAKQALKGEMIYVTNELYTIPIGIENFWKTNKEGPELL